MNEKAITRGDVVVLKSGSPPMTVRAVGPEEDDGEGDLLDGQCLCMWFDVLNSGSGADRPQYGSAVRSETFHVDMLARKEVP